MKEDCRKGSAVSPNAFLVAVTSAALFLGKGTFSYAAAPLPVLEPQSQTKSEVIVVTVVDTKGDPVIGANVIEKGTTNGGISDVEGHVRISVALNQILQVSFVGYQTQEVEASPDLRVVLREDSEALDEVVVVGYGSQKRINLTGAVSSVDVGKMIDSRPVADIGRALQGAVSGLSVTTGSGEIGSSPTLKIRGSIGSPNGSANPLILVDNVEVSDISLVNPDDIENISVLKDAASASIYGARGAFGVVLITTKAKNRNDRFSVNYSNNFAWRTPTVTPRQLPGWQQADINLKGVVNQSKGSAGFYDVVGNMRVDAAAVRKMKEYWENYGYGEQFGPEMVYGRDFEFRDGGMFFYRTWDWYDMYILNWSPQQTHTLSVNGGNGRTSYNIALGYINQEGMMKVNTDEYTRYNANVSLNSDLNKYLSLRAGVMYTRAEYDKPFNYSSELYDPLYYLYRWQPIYPYGTFEGKDFRNVLTDQQHAPKTTEIQEFFRLSGGLTLRLFTDFTLDVDAVYTHDDTRFKKNGTPSRVNGYNIFSPVNTLEELRKGYGNYQTEAYDYVHQEYGLTENLTANVVATYSHNWKGHELKVMGGSNIEKSKFEFFSARRMDLLEPDRPELNLATGLQTNNSEHTWWAVAGFFGRINYSYKDKYMLELNGRYDGSSRFPSGQKFAFFPSMSAGYRISEEAFMQKLKPYLSSLKFRASWGMIGNQDVGTDRFISTLSTTQDNWVIDGQKVQSTQMPTLVSSRLRWEKVITLDAGVDARFFNDELGVTFDWYNRRTSDILTTANLPWVLGAEAPYENLGVIETPGWEIAVDWSHVFGNGFRLGLNASLSDYITRVTRWTNNTGIPTYGMGDGWWSSAYYKEGMTLGDIWGLQFDRFLTADDFNADGSLKAGLPDQTEVFPSGYRLAPGDVLYKDVDGDGAVTKGTTVDKPGDLRVIGNAMPRFQFGFGVNAAWKGVDVNLFFQGVGKKDLWAAGNQVLPGFTSGEPYYAGAEDYWTPENPGAFYPRPMVYSQTTDGNYQINDRYLLHMAYVRLKTLTVGYSFPQEWMKKLRVQGLRVYFTGENLFTFDGVKPAIDPEIEIRTVGTRSDQRNFGRSYPFQKTVSFGVQLSL